MAPRVATSIAGANIILTPEAGKRVAMLRHQAELARQVIFEGTGNVIGMTPGAVFRFSNRELASAEHRHRQVMI